MSKIKFWGKITKDLFFDLGEHPEHLSEVEIDVEDIERVMKNRLAKLGAVVRKCKGCKREVFMVACRDGINRMITLDFTDHSAECSGIGKTKDITKTAKLWEKAHRKII